MNKQFQYYYSQRLKEAGLIGEQEAQETPEPPPSEEPQSDQLSTVEEPTEAPAPPEDMAASMPPEQGASDTGGVEPPAVDSSPQTTSIHFSEYITEYVKTASKYADNPSILEESLKVARDLDDLSPFQRNFIEMNISAVSLLDERVIVEAQKKIRRNESINEMMDELERQIDTIHEISDSMQKLINMGPDKSNMFRQLLSVLLGGAVLPGATGGEVAFLPKKSEETTNLRPQVYTTWGVADLGPVVLDGNSLSEYLGEEERQKINDGAPEERRVLRNRLFIEAVSNQLSGGNYYIVVINPVDGSWQSVSFTSDILREAYESGTISVIEAAPEPTGGLAVDEDGDFVTMASWGIALLDSDNAPISPVSGEKEVTRTPIAKLDGDRLIWQATPEQMRQMGLTVNDHMWSRGNPDKLKEVQRKVPNARQKLMGV